MVRFVGASPRATAGGSYSPCTEPGAARTMTVRRLRLEQFTAFEDFDIELSSGVNAFVGDNGTGKTHLMKVLYAACDITQTETTFADKLVRVFLPSGRRLGRLVRRRRGIAQSVVSVFGDDGRSLRLQFETRATGEVRERSHRWRQQPMESAFIPVKEMLSNGPGFRSLYASREVHFEEVYADILDRAYRPILRGPMDADRRSVLSTLGEALQGKVTVKNEEFYFRDRRGDLEFTLLAEGIRKLALIWLLIQNGTLLEGSVLFWDEPEANLNPALLGHVVETVLELRRLGVQVFLATHNFSVLKELELRRREDDRVRFHALCRDRQTGRVDCDTSSNYLGISPNLIEQSIADLFDRQVQRTVRGREL